MKITAVDSVVVGAGMRNWIFVIVRTDVPGLDGIGEATCEFQTRAVVGAVSDLAELIIGRDPREIERLWQILHRHPFFKGGPVTMSAVSGIDQALHDIAAKDLAVPLYRLLGGLARDRVRLYGHLGGGDSEAVYNEATADRFAEHAHELVAAGFTIERAVVMTADAIVRREPEMLVRELRADEITEQLAWQIADRHDEPYHRFLQRRAAWQRTLVWFGKWLR